MREDTNFKASDVSGTSVCLPTLCLHFLLAANFINILAASKRQPVNYKIVLQKPSTGTFVGATNNFKGVNLLFVPHTVILYEEVNRHPFGVLV